MTEETDVLIPQVLDADGVVIEIGTKVESGEALPPGEVVRITEPDTDAWPDGSPRPIYPRVCVLWPEAEGPEDVEEFPTTHSAHGPGDDTEPWIAADLVAER